MVMVIVILIVLGLCLGSFINAFIWRHYKQALLREEAHQAAASSSKKPKKSDKKALTATELSIAKGRSMCTHCHHSLAARDLVPVVSYVMLRGKCRYCGEPIEDTPLAEVLTPLLFIVSYLFWPNDLKGTGLFLLVSWLVFVCGFVALTLYDLRWFLLPHNIVMPLILLAVGYDLAYAFIFHGGVSALLSAIWGALIIAGLFCILYYISPKVDDVGGEVDESPADWSEKFYGLLFGWILGYKSSKWLGGGDISLGLLLGLLVGGPVQAFLLIFLSSFLGTLVALPMLITRKATRSTHLPFGPFLIIAAIIVVLFGNQIIGWYTGPFTLWLNSIFVA